MVIIVDLNFSVHIACLIVEEPMWKFKLDLSPWFCRTCRKNHCSKCLQDNTYSVSSEIIIISYCQ